MALFGKKAVLTAATAVMALALSACGGSGGSGGSSSESAAPYQVATNVSLTGSPTFDKI